MVAPYVRRAPKSGRTVPVRGYEKRKWKRVKIGDEDADISYPQVETAATAKWPGGPFTGRINKFQKPDRGEIAYELDDTELGQQPYRMVKRGKKTVRVTNRQTLGRDEE